MAAFAVSKRGAQFGEVGGRERRAQKLADALGARPEPGGFVWAFSFLSQNAGDALPDLGERDPASDRDVDLQRAARKVRTGVGEAPGVPSRRCRG